jgi:hypothetical protein
MLKDIVIRFLNNRCTETEVDELVRWAGTEEAIREGAPWGFEEWNSFGEVEEPESDEKFSRLFDKIRGKIAQKDFVDVNSGRKRPVFALIIDRITKVAAILLIPVLAFLIYTILDKESPSGKVAGLATDSLEIVAPIGSRTVVQLSDGSVVHLNYGSKIKYPQYFEGEIRSVILAGEGYFEVAPNPDMPFVVKTGKLNIKATGTSFNVLAYPDNEVVETTLVEGKVVLERTGSRGETGTIGSMVPGQQVRYNRTTGIVKSAPVNVEKYIAWKDGKLVFDDATLDQVAERLSRMYNVEVEVADEIKDFIYTVTFIDEPLSQICDLMTIATPVSYTAPPRKKMPDGSFSKQRIIFKKRE